MPQVFASWSGGKDCCLALHRALSNGMDVVYLANTVSEDGRRSCSHGVAAEVIGAQSHALEIPIVQWPTTGDTYEAEFITMLRSFRKEGIVGGVFGDIDFNAHREWIERVCLEAGITPFLPLWLDDQRKLLMEFIDAGFESIVVAARAEFFGDEVLGRTVDADFMEYLDELAKTKQITPCGEAGEYHTLVVDGPIFKKRLGLLNTSRTTRDGIHFLDIASTELIEK